MAEGVNLDAIISREDFLASEDGIDAGSLGKTEATCTDLKKGESFNITLRKPDFQRETNAWSPEAIKDFIEAFIEGDLIPSVVMWQSPSRLSFVIDGAHRLSVIMAWLLDDYGDGELSIKFYNNKIPEKQRKLADKVRTLINKSVGSYKALRAETENPGSNPSLTHKARGLAHAKIPLLWIRSNEAKKAERAFFIINQSAVTIDPTELMILNSRFKPNAIACRAIVKNGTGHKYWKEFSAEGQADVERIAQEVHRLLYTPPLNTPIRSTELPIAGHGYGSQTVPLIFDFVNIAHGFPVIDTSKRKKKDTLNTSGESPDEQETLRVMRSTLKLAQRLTGTSPSSLGLYPAIYFYSANGRHQPTSVLAISAMVKELVDQDKLVEFSKNRSKFEDFLLSHKFFINQLTIKHGSMAKGFKPMKDYYFLVLRLCAEDKNHEEILEVLKNNEKLSFLSKEKAITTEKVKDFSQNTKQFVFLKETVDKAMTCNICRSRIDPKSMSLDHIEDKKNGGLGTAENAQWTHPYCNSTYKTKAFAA